MTLNKHKKLNNKLEKKKNEKNNSIQKKIKKIRTDINEYHGTSDMFDVFHTMNKRFQEEKDTGRKLIVHNLHVKVCHEQRFETISDEELFHESNIETIRQIISKLNICIDDQCNSPKCKNLIFLYTSKKAGSTSLWGSINLYLNKYVTTFHIHSESYLENMGIYSVSMIQLFKILKMYNKNLFVIDIYRPIFDTCASVYFNELGINFQRDFSKSIEFKNKDIIIKRFFNLFDYYYNKYNVDYFMEEYNIPDPKNRFKSFDFEKKYLIYEDGLVKYIKLRLCDSAEWPQILSQYFGYDFKVIKYNETSSKKWGNLYDYFNEKFFISPEIYDRIKNNEYFNFYFSPGEREKYLNKFNNKIIIDNDNTINKKINKIFSPVFNHSELEFYYRIIVENEVKQQYGHIVKESNSPIVYNCSCEYCTIKYKKIIHLYESS